MRNEINGIIFEKMMRNALNNLYVHEKEVNDMNVFPVADGDTGTNMRLTLENGINNAVSEKHLGRYLKSLSNGMLLGARGNSGVILSQLFKGMYLTLKGDSIVNPGEMANAFINGYKTAYKAVLNPVEGTILSVTRMGIENIRHLIKGKISMQETFKIYVEELNKCLKLTPNMLPVLKEANVLDSGAKGYIVIIEGMYKYLLGEIVDRDLVNEELKEEKEEIEVGNGYYLEIEIKAEQDDFPLEEITKKIKELSYSFKLNKIENTLSIIAYTENPTSLISVIRKFGKVVTLKLEESKRNDEIIEIKEIPFKAIVYIACLSGGGVKSLYKDMGVDIFLSSNPSTQDFLNAFKKINAEKIVILPNDKNILETANQAVKLSGLTNIEILNTKNVLEGYYALAMDVPDSSVENRLMSIKESVDVCCLNVSKASKDYSKDLVNVKVGDYVTYKDNVVLSGDPDLFSCLGSALKSVDDIDSKSTAFIILGKNNIDCFEDKVNEFFTNNYDYLDINILDGGQEKELLIIGLL